MAYIRDIAALGALSSFFIAATYWAEIVGKGV